MTIQKLIQQKADLLCEYEVAVELNLAPNTLQVWRSTGRYNLPFVKVGRNVRYRRTDVQKWLEERTRTSGATA